MLRNFVNIQLYLCGMQKYLIVGLGNKGEEYKNTRHNIGFLIADEVVNSQGETYKASHLGWVSQFKYKARPVTVLKPNTYMNLSGNAVKYWMQKENIPLENLLVMTDDLNLKFATIRIRAKGSDGGHNGLKSIQQNLQTTQYPKLRFGIGDRFSKGKQVDYVLGKWSPEEMEYLPQRVAYCKDAVLQFIFGGIHSAMNQYNGDLILKTEKE